MRDAGSARVAARAISRRNCGERQCLVAMAAEIERQTEVLIAANRKTSRRGAGA
jgi:hypothetical protein